MAQPLVSSFREKCDEILRTIDAEIEKLQEELRQPRPGTAAESNSAPRSQSPAETDEFELTVYTCKESNALRATLFLNVTSGSRSSVVAFPDLDLQPGGVLSLQQSAKSLGGPIDACTVWYECDQPSASWSPGVFELCSEQSGDRVYYDVGSHVFLPPSQQLELEASSLSRRSEEQGYVLTVVTSNIAGAGTRANVFLVLHGKDGTKQSRTNHLLLSFASEVPECFEQGQRGDFAVDLPLLDIDSVEIAQDGLEQADDWHVDYVMLTHQQTGKQFRFPCEEWIHVAGGKRVFQEFAREDLAEGDAEAHATDHNQTTVQLLQQMFPGDGSSYFETSESNDLQAFARTVMDHYVEQARLGRFADAFADCYKQLIEKPSATAIGDLETGEFMTDMAMADIVDAHDDPDGASKAFGMAFCDGKKRVQVYQCGDGEAMNGVLVAATDDQGFSVALVHMTE
eukprot:m.654 g.654  ORF g.654 m.654 type:complete len:455 (-) comp265_c0_seq1:250-1614(-)